MNTTTANTITPRFFNSPNRRLILADGTHRDIGPALTEHIVASEEAGGGLIEIDPNTFRVVRPDDFRFLNPTTVKVYVY